jgi:exopolysaccharide biosynthesis polyprenyl glycosylphosphotransferase
MLRETSKLIMRMHMILDLFLTGSAFVAAYFIKKDLLPEPYRGLITVPNYYIVLLLIIIIWYLVFRFFDLYASYRKQNFGRIFWEMVKGVFVSFLLLSFLMYFFKITDVSRIMMGIFLILNITMLGFTKGFAYRTLTRFRAKGFNFRNILIIGSREGAKEVIDAIGDRLEAGYRILGCLEINGNKVGEKVKNGVKVIDTVESMEKILLKDVVDELIFAMPLHMITDVEKYISMAEDVGVAVRILPQWHIRQLGYTPNIGSLHFETFLGIPTMALTTTPNGEISLLIKSLFDYTMAAIAMIFFLPLFMVIAGAIKLCSKGPVFFKQERLGLNGRKFILYKFRTMTNNAEEEQKKLKAMNEADGPAFKIKKDPRIVPIIGTFLRKTGIDELPQLINVLKGEMSIVGPRPPVSSEVGKYDNWQRRRLSMKPGLTCLWQITPCRNDVCFEEWMNLDLKYIDNWSLGLDIKILLKTPWALLTGEGR